MEQLLAAIEATSLAQYLRTARWGYAAVNTAHVLGIALLVGAILPLNLRLVGFWRSVPVAPLARVLVPIASTGLAIAVVAGLLLFSIRAREYADLGIFQTKFALIALGTAAALGFHRRYGMQIDAASPARLAVHAVISTTCWIGALLCGRFIAFVAG